MESSNYYPPPSLRQSTPPGLDSKMDPILQEYEITKEGEQRRHKFLENLMKHIERLTLERDEALRKLQGTERLNVAYQGDLSLASQKIDALQKSMDCDRFVLAVIDGDNALFEDECVKDGAAGGERVAQKLRQSIVDYLTNKPYYQHDFKIVIRVFINLQGLAKTYVHDAKIIPHNSVLLSFIQGFNRTHELGEMVDAGNLKEAADSKVKALLSLNRRNIHCKHILLAASGDNSYAGFLRQFIAADSASQQVTLVEALPFARDLAQLTSHFQVTKLDDVFRTSKIITDKYIANGTARVPLTENSSNVWARNTAQPASLPYRTPTSPEVQGATLAKTGIPVPQPHKEILVNAHNERLDSYVRFDKQIYNDIKTRKLCNAFWLLDACKGGCGHHHTGKLSTTELEQLKLVARTNSCRAELDCKNPDCIDGHRCQAGDRCYYGEKCRFSKEMHLVSMERTRAVPVEWVGDDYDGGWELQVK